MSQEALAFEVGVHRTYLGSVERGERNVSLLDIVRIAAAVEIKGSDLLERRARTFVTQMVRTCEPSGGSG